MLFSYQKLRPATSIFRSSQGAVSALIAVTFLLMILVAAVVVDLARLHLVRSKAQNASDAALLGAVATSPLSPIQDEMLRLWRLNFPQNYMSATGGPVNVVQLSSSPEVYEISFAMNVPTFLMQLFGADASSVNVLTRVQRGLGSAPGQNVEMALALDNTGSMIQQNKIQGLRDATTSLINTVFGGSATLSNLNVTLVPFDVAVLVPHQAGWVQGPFQGFYKNGLGFLANRNRDYPPTAQNDLTDDAPGTEGLRFRTPQMDPASYIPPNWTYPGTCRDWPTPTPQFSKLRPVTFASNNKQQLLADAAALEPSGSASSSCTRTNVGLQWAWMALSPKWQGLWDSTRSNLPRSSARKIAVMMTDGQNTVYMGSAPNSRKDDDTFAQTCTAMKAAGITIYSIAFGSDANQALVRACATDPAKYFFAPTNAQLVQAFTIIGNDVVYPTVRIVK